MPTAQSSTVRKIHFIIRGSLERAVRWRHLGVNKAALAVTPSPAPSRPDPPGAEEAALMLSEAWASDPDWGLLLWLTMVTGSRRGEVSALRWHHLDLVAALAHRTQQRPAAGRSERETDQDPPAKTRCARSSDARHAGRPSRTMRAGAARRSVAISTRTAYLFSPAPDGSTPWAPRALTQRYGHMARKLKLRSSRLHSLRHYSATELIAAGVDVRTVAGRLGGWCRTAV